MKKAFIIFSLFLNFYSQAQNLVPNYSFEDTLHCPNNPGEINAAFPWYSPTSSTTDYFNECGFVGYVGVPANIWGFQHARTGKAYAEIGVYGTSSLSIRDYIQIQLIDTLIAGKNYCVSFYVSPAGVSGFSNSYMPVMISEIGLLFSNNAIITTNTLPLPYTPQIVSPAGVFLNDTAQWMEISGTYTALGGERFITIGNFKDDVNTDTIRLVDNGLDPQGYYYIDDVSVTECDTSSGINETQKDYGINMYPNPNNGNMTLKYSINANDIAFIQITDITGKQIARYSVPAGTNAVQINNEQLESGIYIYHIIVNNKPVKSDKLLIIK